MRLFLYSWTRSTISWSDSWTSSFSPLTKQIVVSGLHSIVSIRSGLTAASWPRIRVTQITRSPPTSRAVSERARFAGSLRGGLRAASGHEELARSEARPFEEDLGADSALGVHDDRSEQVHRGGRAARGGEDDQHREILSSRADPGALRERREVHVRIPLAERVCGHDGERERR